MNYAVIGKNINYSLSPIIHHANFKSLGINASYEIINIDDIDKEIVKLRQLNGFNITIPYKQELIKYCSHISEEAKFVQAVNCVHVINHKFYGYNTDIYGFYQLMKVNHVDPYYKNVLIIGAGGAGRAVFYCLKKYFNYNLTVTNRTINKARKFTNNIIEIEK
ncbi:MAG: aroE, partial [Haloplasmataceae bacterium]|nr:aroE [Haloplasmataceae bacterium]